VSHTSTVAAAPDVSHASVSLDGLLASSDVSRLDPATTAELRLRLIREAAAWHLRRNDRYARYCAGVGFSLGDLRDPSDLVRLPLLPASLFKRGAETVATRPADDMVLHTTSSGTQGAVSVVPRDDLTLNRFFATAGIGVFEVLGQERSELRWFNIVPVQAGHLWIAYVMAGVAVFSDGDCYVEDDTFLVERFLTDLAAARDSAVLVVGPPALILDAADAARAAGITLHPGSMVITIGGWKRATGKMIPRAEFIERVGTAYGLTDGRQVRDTFNMVELNTVIFECAEHTLHVPPWLYLDARDPRTLTPLPSGQTGVLAFLDPTPTSYPGFVISDDFATVYRDVPCGCGRTGDTLRVDRRINRIEGRGCALKLDQRTAT
jgi:long-chain-fatty-acid---luciferin-component ligase